MKKMSNIVSSLTFFALVLCVACSGSRHPLGQNGDSQQALIKEGNDRLRESSTIQTTLADKYQIDLNALQTPSSGSALKSTTVPGTVQLNWRHFRKAQRREVQGLIARYLQAINRVLEIDSVKDITIDHRELVLADRDAAEIVQKSIEKFEALNGENYDPVSDESLRPLE